jgi:thiol-disulfide isomerase/thioredoxin
MGMKNRLLLVILLPVFFLGVFMVPAAAQTSPPEGAEKVILYFFWGDGCPHCAKEEIYLEALKKKYPQIEVKSYEVWHNRSNALFFSRMAEAAGIQSTGVPVTFINTEVFAGFDDRKAQAIENRIQYCIRNRNACAEPSETAHRPFPLDKHQIITVPFLGDIDTSEISLLLSLSCLGIGQF